MPGTSSIARVDAVSRETGFVVADRGRGDYIVFEPLGAGDFDVGDEVEGEFRKLGSQVVINRRSRRPVRVYVQDRHMSREAALNLAQLPLDAR